MNETSAMSTTLVSLPTAAGTFEAALTDRGVCCLMFPNQLGAGAGWLARHLPDAEVGSSDRRAGALADELDAYLRGDLTDFQAPLDLVGTPFRVSVWRQLRT